MLVYCFRELGVVTQTQTNFAEVLSYCVEHGVLYAALCMVVQYSWQHGLVASQSWRLASLNTTSQQQPYTQHVRSKNPHAKHPKQRQPFVFSFSNFAHIIVPSAISSHPARQNKDRLDIHTNNETLLKFPDKIGKYSSKQQYVPVHFKTCVVQSGPAALRLLPGTSIEQTK